MHRKFWSLNYYGREGFVLKCVEAAIEVQAKASRERNFIASVEEIYLKCNICKQLPFDIQIY